MVSYDGLTSVERNELQELETMLLDTGAYNANYDVYRGLAGDISLLSLKVEMGEPLEGRCSLCPHITIKD